MVSSLKELRDSIASTSRQTTSQIGSLIDDFINMTLSEIHNPAWAFPRKDVHHLWNFLKRKTTFSTVASQEEYVLERDVDKVALIRQTASPVKLEQITDELFYKLVPNPTATGNPKWYRIWDQDGVSTRLTTADTIDVVSDSASDDGSAELSISVSGYDSNGIFRTETYQLNGTSTVQGSITFAARNIFISKQKNTTGKITITENSGGSTLAVIGPKERNPRFKVANLYPIPSSVVTMYIEYYARMPYLNNDSDSPIFDEKWHYVVRLGALSKVYQYLNKESDFANTQLLYAGAVRSMVADDKVNTDLVEYLNPEHRDKYNIHNVRSSDAISS